MPPKRHRSLAVIRTVPRSTLEHTCHREIDVILKDLRLCSRRLKSALDSFKDELRTQERLYYKCKNQHRMALFFKRVSEMRRYGRRLSELCISEHVDLLRASFVGLENTNDHKASRGSWTDVPEQPYIHVLTERLTDCSALVCKIRARLENAYHHFTLAMQAGAFVQLIVLFVAMTCRMSTLTSHLEEALHLGITTCNHLIVSIHPIGSHAIVPLQLASEPAISSPSHTDRDLPSEDTGQLISPCEPAKISAFVVEATVETRVLPPPSHLTDVADNFPTRVSEMIVPKVIQKPRPKKAKKKMDEIDEIFGF